MNSTSKSNEIKEKVIEWLDVTGAIPKGTGWYHELLSFFDDEVSQALQTARREALEEAAKIAEQDSVLCWVGGSTGNAKMTADWIAQAIRTHLQGEEKGEK